MCHMMADTRAELLAMADKIGVNKKWIQDYGQGTEHFDICLSKRKKAVAAGAKEMGMIEMGRFFKERILSKKLPPNYFAEPKKDITLFS